MATLALGALGSAVGGALLPAGLSVFGSTIAGAALGSQIGSLIGSSIDQALFGASGNGRAVDGPRLSDLRVMASSEGAPIPRLYGRTRLGGQVIWATALEEEAVDGNAGGGGKGGAPKSNQSGVNYVYYANFAVALCEGVITGIGRVWADGREIDLADHTVRIYKGDATQAPDALIEAKQGVSQAPAYRGIAYVVFEHFPLAQFGNRIPQLSFEVSRAVDTTEANIRGVCLIPGSGEFVYAQTPVRRSVGRISSASENVHTKQGGTDWDVSLDQLQSTLPNASSVSLIVSWFGSDLRADQCTIRPCVERSSKPTSPVSWSVAGATRASAAVVSSHEGRPAYGGTPTDQSVVDAIRDLQRRGLSVVFSPFILMDVPAGNALTDPYSAATTQPAYPWRGRITVAPAPGRPGTPDKSTAANAAIAAFVGAAQPSDFTVTGDSVAYSGPSEWSFRRFILHYAKLCAAAGGVDAFVLGSELRGLTTLRDSANSFPFVTALMQLAADVRAILGPSTKILYAADWSEYFGHQPSDGSNDVYFHLDPLWASPHIDCIGIDLYWPLTDWRDGTSHLDAATGVASPHDLDYLKRGLHAGEGFDWYYASDADRLAQTRTPITDGGGQPWMFRYKDLKSWWSNAHHNRPGGVASAVATAWVPQSKPFWFMEIGCPAVDKGANQPNLFIDPKSSESHLPHFSTGARDDFMQRRLLQAITEALDPTHAGYIEDSNPASAVYAGRMIDTTRTHVYCWDARPYPAFPTETQIWGDGANWRLGHWINGRTASAPMPALVSQLLEDYGFDNFDARDLRGLAQGFVIDRIMSARDALQPLQLAFFFDALESNGRIVFRQRGQVDTGLRINATDLVETSSEADLSRLTRGQETDLPASAKITYISAGDDYAQAAAEARRIAGASGRVSTATLPIVLDSERADAIAESWLFEVWGARERAAFALPPSRIAVEVGDVVTLNTGRREHTLRITEIGDHGAREIEARSIDRAVYGAVAVAPRSAPTPRPVVAGQPYVVMLDLPPAEIEPPHVGLIAAAQLPWPGPLAVYRSPDTAGFTLDTTVAQPAITGLTTSVLSSGPVGRMDRATSITVMLDRGTLTSVSDLALLAGANTVAVEVAANVWEVLQFQTATLLAPLTYQLSNLLRGQRGSDALMLASIPTGARLVILDAAVATTSAMPSDVGLTFNWAIGPANRNIGDARYIQLQQAFSGIGLKPWKPVHVRGERNSAGDLTISWQRRTRSGGDTWNTDDVPLGESSEQYIVEIVDGAIIKRTINASAPTVSYNAAAQLTDFGAVPSAITVRIAQVNPDFGRGYAASASL